MKVGEDKPGIMEHFELDEGNYRLRLALADEDQWTYQGRELPLKKLLAPLGH